VERIPNPDGTARVEGITFRSPFRSLRRLGAIAKLPDGRNGADAEALEADALLLREENARLRVKLEASPDMGRVIERLRAMPAPQSSNGSEPDPAEDAWQMLTDVIVMRNSLIDICREMGQVMANLEQSLEAISTPDESVGGEAAVNGTRRNGVRRNGHLKEAQP
jgi:hypothetical protein